MPAETRTIPVHALADERIHLAPAHLGRLKQGRLKTLCGLLAVSALSPFALADPARRQCKTCFGSGNPAKATTARPKSRNR
jgi:hypothetical protein